MKNVLEIKRTGTTPSHVVIGDVLGSLDSYLPSKRVIVITDPNVHRHYSHIIDRFDHIIIGLGEKNKTLLTLHKIMSELIEMNADRHCFILGMGGGIVTDVAGFTASTYMRGLQFGFVATSLLAQVDASVGGKNGVNVDGYKNMVGVFNQPDFVLCDTQVLKTLPEREVKSGMAEMIKAGIIADAGLFEIFEQNDFHALTPDDALLTRAITASVAVKAKVVEADEREGGVRKLLNLGHTFGHAIEKSTSEYLHGEAVSIGVAMIASLSAKLGLTDEKTVARIKRVLFSTGLPTESKIDTRRILDALRHDKKRENQTIDLILIQGIGDCRIRRMTFDELEKLMLV